MGRRDTPTFQNRYTKLTYRKALIYNQSQAGGRQMGYQEKNDNRVGNSQTPPLGWWSF